MTIRVGGERLARLGIPTREAERDRTSGKRSRGPVLRWAGLRPTTPGANPDLRVPTVGLHALLKRFGPEERQ